jgi:hypothetical protein
MKKNIATTAFVIDLLVSSAQAFIPPRVALQPDTHNEPVDHTDAGQLNRTVALVSMSTTSVPKIIR